MHAVSYAFGREEGGTILGDMETVFCLCIFYNMAKSAAFQKIFRFLKSVVHIPEERHLGLASLVYLG